MPNGAPSIQQLRADFLKASTLRSQQLPRQAYSTGEEISFRLPHAGFGAFCIFDFQGQIVISGSGGVLAESDKAPYNLFDFSFDDYLGINRHTVNGYDYHQRLVSLRHYFDEANSNLAAAYSTTRYNFSIGGGNGAAGTYPLKFAYVMPISLHENTTEGSFPFTVPGGDNVVTLTGNTEVGSNNEAVLKQTTAGFTVTFSGTIGCTYYYFDVPTGTPLPLDDFALVHELRRIKDATNLTAGEEYRYPLRTGRTYYQVIGNLRLNDVADTTDVTNIAFYVDGNTSTLDESLTAYLNRIYMKFSRDLSPGTFLWDFWRKPWTPNSYGSLELALELASGATTTGNSYVHVFMESMYQTSKILTDLQAMAGAQKA